MNIYEFMDKSPLITVLLALILSSAIVRIIISLLFNLPNRVLRHQNIRKHGYPPSHCDADGDFKPEKKEEQI